MAVSDLHAALRARRTEMGIWKHAPQKWEEMEVFSVWINGMHGYLSLKLMLAPQLNSETSRLMNCPKLPALFDMRHVQVTDS